MTDPAIVEDDTLTLDPETPKVEETPPEAPAAEVTETPAEPPEPKVEFDEAQQAKVDAILGKTTKRHYEKMSEIEDEKKRLAEELETLRAKVPEDSVPVVPPAPDPFDDDYQAKLEARDKALLEKANWDATQTMKAQRETEAQQQLQQKEQQQAYEKTVAFISAGDNMGIEQEDLAKAMMSVGQVGLGKEMADYIVGDPQGPELTLYLSKNLQEVEKIRGMSTPQAAVYVEGLREKAKRPSPEVTPPPTDQPTGSGYPDDPYTVDGATFL